MEEKRILFSDKNWGEFGQRRIKETLAANEEKRITFSVPAGRWLYIIKWRFGDITANQINIRWDGVRNIWEENILIGTELLNFVIEPFPYPICSGNSGSIVIANTSDEVREFEMVYDFILMDKETSGHITEFIFRKRREFMGKIEDGPM